MSPSLSLSLARFLQLYLPWPVPYALARIALFCCCQTFSVLLMLFRFPNFSSLFFPLICLLLEVFFVYSTCKEQWTLSILGFVFICWPFGKAIELKRLPIDFFFVQWRVCRKSSNWFSCRNRPFKWSLTLSGCLSNTADIETYRTP